MASDVYGARHPYRFRRNVARNGGLLLAFATFAAVVLIIAGSITQPFGYFDFSSTVSTTTPLALAAIGETIVVIGRGLDLSAGAVISLSNCLVVTHMGDGTASIVAWTIIGVLAGTLVGAANGILVVAFRLQPIVATLATMFIAQGLTLLVMNEPGGAAQPAFAQFFTGDAIPGVVVLLTVNQQAGGALLAVAEGVGIPLIAATLAEWVRADAVEAREVDARLDEEGDGQPERTGLWWESDPRFADRFGRRPEA